ncbi:Deoxyribonucleoside regulator [Koleobacter methoxysyntrophicus]|uniref:Deoxyribonucleoside regulator n=1 Tax=Koleobacter methoxysyntrophicus TaxID=2751313 RepID=A0A8A0RPU4_9FIRM|nr:sugar-binding transcriptional regulator [Koleobacter methoxysyntrophicus]QSQ09588.1 Deoxyribonucleoside regulator [Koleobacter methoxysyntrophicus]
MRTWKDERLMVKIANMYYNENLTQQNISDRLGISRPVVSRLLQRAREENIVEIKINSFYSFADKEKLLEKMYNLEEVIIVPYQNEGAVNLKEILGEAAADYLERIIKDGDIVGVSWGTTLYEIPRHLTNKRVLPNTTFVPLVGGIGQTKYEVHSNQIVIQLAEKFGCKCILLHAPAIVDSIEIKEIIISDMNAKNVLELARKSDIALVGVGAPISTSNILKSGYIGERELKNLKQSGAIGDICTFFFNEKGELCDVEINNRVVGITLDDLRKIPRVIGIAGGKQKAMSILGALRGSYLDVLVTDERTADYLISQGR